MRFIIIPALLLFAPLFQDGAATRPALPEVPPPVIPVSASTALIPIGTVHSRPAAGAEPKVEFETQEFDFGGVDAGKIATAEVEFKNNGKGDLQILQVRPMCACVLGGIYVNGKLYRLSDPIPPGAVGKLRFSIRPLWGAGEKHTRIDLLTNDPSYAPTSEAPFGHVQIKINARIQKIIEFTDEAGAVLADDKLDLGATQGDADRDAKMIIKSSRGQNFEILGIVPKLEKMKVDYEPIGDRAGTDRWLLKIHIDKGLPYGPFMQQFQVATSPDMFGIKFHVAGDVRGMVLVNPALPRGLQLGALKTSPTPVAKITFTTTGGLAPLKLKNIQFLEFRDFKLVDGLYIATGKNPRPVDRRLGDLMSAEVVEIEPGKKAEIKITMKPGLPKGAMTFILWVETSVPGGPPTLAIPVSGVVIG